MSYLDDLRREGYLVAAHPGAPFLTIEDDGSVVLGVRDATARGPAHRGGSGRPRGHAERHTTPGSRLIRGRPRPLVGSRPLGVGMVIRSCSDWALSSYAAAMRPDGRCQGEPDAVDVAPPMGPGRARTRAVPVVAGRQGPRLDSRRPRLGSGRPSRGRGPLHGPGAVRCPGGTLAPAPGSASDGPFAGWEAHRASRGPTPTCFRILTGWRLTVDGRCVCAPLDLEVLVARLRTSWMRWVDPKGG